MNTIITVNTQVLPLSVLGQGPKGDKGDPGEPGASLVESVNGKTGDVVLTHLDVGAEAVGVAQAAAAIYTNNAVASEVTARNAAISVERNRAIGVENALNSALASTNLDLTNEINRAIAAENAEIARATAAELTLAGDIATEIARASNAESILAGEVASAQADASQALLDAANALDRSNHTGMQAATTITQDSTHRFATDAEKAAWNTAEQNAKTYADSLVVGLFDDRGSYDASTNAFPSTGGSGPAGTILKGDLWIVSVAGDLPGPHSVTPGDTIRALVDEPLQLPANWAVLENNLNYEPAPASHVGSGGVAHANATALEAGFMSATDKAALDALDSYHEKVSSTGSISGGLLSLTGGVNFSVSAGEGHINNGGPTVDVSWGVLTGACLYNGDNWIYIDSAGALQIFDTETDSPAYIHIGYIQTTLFNTVVVGFSNLKIYLLPEFERRVTEYLRFGLGPRVKNGCAVSEQANPNFLKLNITSGSWYLHIQEIDQISTSSFTKVYFSTSGTLVDTNNLNEVNTSQWNDTTQSPAGALVTMTAGYWKKDLIATTPNGTVYYAFGQAEFATQQEAEDGPLPVLPDNIKNSICYLAAIVSQQGATTVGAGIIDIRPTVDRLNGFGGVAAPTVIVDHGATTGLGDDDHPQYHNDARGDVRYYTKAQSDANYAPLAAYKIRQIVTGTIAQQTVATVTPAFDNTAPDIAEGAQLFQVAGFTPTDAGSKIIVLFGIWLDNSTNNRNNVVSVFYGNTLMSSKAVNLGTSGRPVDLSYNKAIVPGSVTPVTIQARLGVSGGTAYVNQGSGGQTLGGSGVTDYVIIEVGP